MREGGSEPQVMMDAGFTSSAHPCQKSLLRLPPDYRAMTGYRRIPYRDLSRNWRTWERDRYWERHGWGRPEREREHGVAPGFRDRERERHDLNRGRERERER